jgi:hypothetical protein
MADWIYSCSKVLPLSKMLLLAVIVLLSVMRAWGAFLTGLGALPFPAVVEAPLPSPKVRNVTLATFLLVTTMRSIKPDSNNSD